MGTIYDFSAKDIDGNEVHLGKYKGKVVLIVNVASECGMTPQYAGLQEIYEKHSDQGLVILGFPCNQFGAQEPGDESEIKQFCQTNYKVTFPMFGKVQVNGRSSHPLFKYLREEARGLLGSTAIKWNFTKFLIDHHGNPLKRFGPKDAPAKVLPAIKKALGVKIKEEKKAASLKAKEEAKALKESARLEKIARKSGRMPAPKVDTGRVEVEIKGD